MRLLKSAVMGIMVAVFMVLLSAASFAKQGHEQEKIKLLNDSAAALQVSNPALADSLSKYANDEAQEVKEKKEGKKQMEGAEETMKMRRAERIKLLRDAAAALTASNPKLTERLTKMADRHEKMMKKENK